MSKAAQLVEQFKAILSKGETVENESTEIKMASMKLDDGVTVIEAEAFEAGQPVSIKTEDEQMIALPPSQEGKPYILEDGRELIVVEDGIIDSIGEPSMEEEPVVEEEVAASDSATATPATPKKVIEAVTKESHFSSDVDMPESVLLAISEVVKAELETFKAELKAEQEATELSTQEEVKPIKHNPEAANLSKQEPVKGLTGRLNQLLNK